MPLSSDSLRRASRRTKASQRTAADKLRSEDRVVDIRRLLGRIEGDVSLDNGGIARVTIRPASTGPMPICTCPVGRAAASDAKAWCVHIVAVLSAAADSVDTRKKKPRANGTRNVKKKPSETPEAVVASAVRRFAPSAVWSRSSDLIRAKAVRTWRWQGRALGGEVRPVKEASVSAWVLLDGSVPHPGCTCPAGERGQWCPHSVAVARVAALEAAEVVQDAAEAESRVERQKASAKPTPPAAAPATSAGPAPLRFQLFRKGRDLVVEVQETGGATVRNFGAMLRKVRVGASGGTEDIRPYRRSGSHGDTEFRSADAAVLRLLARQGRRATGTPRVQVGPDRAPELIRLLLRADDVIGPLGGRFRPAPEPAGLSLVIDAGENGRSIIRTTWNVPGLEKGQRVPVLAVQGEGGDGRIESWVLAGDIAAPAPLDAVALVLEVPAAGAEIEDSVLIKRLNGMLRPLPAGTRLAPTRSSRHRLAKATLPVPVITFTGAGAGLQGILAFDYGGVRTHPGKEVIEAAVRLGCDGRTAGSARVGVLRNLTDLVPETADQSLDDLMGELRKELALSVPSRFVDVMKKDRIHWHARDTQGEMDAVAKLLKRGFVVHRDGRLDIEENTAVEVAAEAVGAKTWEGFLLEGVEALAPFVPSEGGVTIDITIRPIPPGEGPVDPKVNQERWGPGWFELGITAQADGEDLDPELLVDMLARGHTHMPISSGGRARIPAGDLAKIQETLARLGARKKKGAAMHFTAMRTGLGLLPKDLGDSTRTQVETPELQALLEGLRSGGTGLVSPSRPQEQAPLRDDVEAPSALEALPRIELPKGLKADLRDYQRDGLDWLSFLADHGLGGVLADDMGLGKTVQTLSLLLRKKNTLGSAPNLVIAPSSVVLGWRDEAARFTPDLKCLTLSGPNRWKAEPDLSTYDIVLTSYALLRRDVEHLAAVQWRSVIFDEAQFLKNLATRSANAARRLRAESRFALSGTPLENRISELYALYDLVLPGFLGKESTFREDVERPIVAGGERAQVAARQLHQRIRPYLMRRLKSDVLRELPARTEVELPIEMLPGQARLYSQILQAARNQVLAEVDANGIGRSAMHVLAALTRLRQVSCDPRLLGKDVPAEFKGSAKLQALRGMLPELVEEGHAALIFSQFTGFLDHVEDLLKEMEIPWLRLDGSTPTKERARRVKEFQTSDGPPLFLISLRAGGTGLNLTRADYVFHLDPWWNPAVEDQATDRAHRIGQTRKVLSYKLITQDTVEARIRSLQQHKRDLAESILGEEGIKQLTRDDLEALLAQ